MVSLTIRQQTNYDGFPKAAELIEIEGAHALEASDRALMNTLLQHVHDSGRLIEADAEWEISFAHLRQAQSRHESNDRIKESIRRPYNPSREFIRSQNTRYRWLPTNARVT